MASWRQQHPRDFVPFQAHRSPTYADWEDFYAAQATKMPTEQEQFRKWAMPDTPVEDGRCNGLTVGNTRCTRRADASPLYCWQHKPYGA
jgi:hypothetical protein